MKVLFTCSFTVTKLAAPCEWSLLCLLEWGVKRGPALIHIKPLRSPQPKSLDQSFFFSLVKLGFSSASILLLINRWSFLSQLYPSNIPRMLRPSASEISPLLCAFQHTAISLQLANQFSNSKLKLGKKSFHLLLQNFQKPLSNSQVCFYTNNQL